MNWFKQAQESSDFCEEKFAGHDACYRKVMDSYGKWSARAAQATAKCRKAKGQVSKTEKGANLKRWEDENGKTPSQERTVAQEARTNTADQLRGLVKKLQRQRERCLQKNSKEKSQKNQE